ncbi:MAG TPA: hypothetical protein VF516_30760 [Kofleriaceae bacterium]
MRLHCALIGLVLAPAACSSSSSSTTLPGDGGGVLSDGGGSLTCGSTVAAYCGASGCQLTLAAAKQDTMLCPASIVSCADWDLIFRTAVDTSTTYYYFQGNLMAVSHSVLPGKMSCLAGPSTFTPPSCQGTAQPLPACP